MKSRFLLLLISLSAFLLSSCDSLDFSRQAAPTGNLEVDVAFNLDDEPKLALKTALVNDNPLIETGEITLEQDDDNYTFDLDIGNGAASAKVTNLAAGPWDLEITLYDEDDYPVMYGTKNVTIIAAETLYTDVTVNYTSGILDLRIHLPAIQADLGYAHTAILSTDGSLFMAGWNQNDQLGFDTGDENNSEVYQATLTDVRQVLLDHKTSMAIKSDGTVWGVGMNSYGELGLGNGDDQENWVQSTGATDIIGGCYGGFKSMLIKSDGSVIGAGHNNYGSFGDGTQQYSNSNEHDWVDIDIDNVKDMACGKYHTLALKEDGTLWATGTNTYGQLGIPTSTTTYVDTYTYVTNNVKTMASFGSFSLILTNDGDVYGAGINGYDQLNQGNTDSADDGFVLVESGVKKIAASSGSNTYLIKDDNSLWACGSDFSSYMQLATNVKSVFAKEGAYIYITFSGDAYAGGYNIQGRLGTGNDTAIDDEDPIIIFGD